MKEWALRFWQDHGDRLIFMGIAAGFGVGFLFTGIKELAGAGTTLLIAVATLALNKARGTPKDTTNK